MTEALQAVFEAASRLPEEEQDALAAAILEELASEERWENAFAASQEALAQLAEEALAEHRAGETQLLFEDDS